VIQTPLDRTSGTLTARTPAYDAKAVAEVVDGRRTTAAGGLAVYNRQYWFRLFEVFQSAFPLTSRLLGCWDFNRHVAGFLNERPPRGWDVDQAVDGFEPFLAAAIAHDDDETHRALAEGILIDAAWRSVLRARAPETPPYRPSSADATRLQRGDARLISSPALAIVEEHRALLDLRAHLLDEPGESRVPLPPPHPSPRAWALVHTQTALVRLPLEPREAELLGLLRTSSVADALARLERACSADERIELPTKARGWLARSVANDFWIGLAAPDRDPEVSRR
jgi:hypothetical protein